MNINETLSLIKSKCGNFSNIPESMKENINKKEIENYLINILKIDEKTTNNFLDLIYDDNEEDKDNVTTQHFIEKYTSLLKILETTESDDEEKNIKNNKNEEEEINLNFLKNFWSVVLMTFDKNESRYKDIEDALEKIRLIQNIFDSSVYINMVFDIIRLKKVIFTETQEKLFNSIHFTAEEINEYIKKYQNNQEFLTKEEIMKIKINLSNEKQNKLTQNIFDNLNV